MVKVVADDSELGFLKEAYKVAAEKATDPSTQNGAVLVDMYRNVPRVMAWGANHFPRGVRERPDRWERPLKYNYVEHAERNAIYHACRSGVSTDQLWMFCPWFACSDCARAIIQAGITHVVGHRKPFDLTPPHWKESIAVALGMLDEAGVKTKLVDGTVGITLRFNGKPVDF